MKIASMKKFWIVLCILAISLGNVNVSRANDKALDSIADVALVRPGCFIATVLGSAAVVVALPFAACSHSVKATADILLVLPAQATFTRPVGDFSSLNFSDSD